MDSEDFQEMLLAITNLIECLDILEDETIALKTGLDINEAKKIRGYEL